MTCIRSVVRIALVAVVSTLVVVPLAGAPVAAAPQPFTLTMVSGEVRIAGTAEPLALQQPTTVSGQHDTGDGGTGAVTAGALVTPPVSFTTDYEGTTVFVDATFSQVTPNSGTGVIDAEGNVSFRTDVTVDLDIEVGRPGLVQACQATPVSLALDSTAPYDPETQRVTVRDADFSVPPVSPSDTCISLVADAVNGLLAGSGHSIALTLEGALALPPAAGCPTTTELEVTPASSFQGDAVTIDAVVAPDPAGAGLPECDDAEGITPSGQVELRADGQVIGVADLDGTGAAQVVTTSLPAGGLTLSARYRGAPPYSASTSDPIGHQVSARPAIVADVPPTFLVDGPPVEFDVAVANTGLGAEVLNARLDLTIAADAPLNDDLVVEWFDGVTWIPVTFQSLGGDLFGSVMPATGRALPVGSEITQRLRVTVPAGTEPTGIDVTFDLVPVDPGTGDPAVAIAPAPTAVASATVPSVFAEGNRRPVGLSITSLSPHTLRQGMVARVQPNLEALSAGPIPSGTYRVLLDGVPVPIRVERSIPEAGYQPTVPVQDAGFAAFPKFVVPPDGRTGTREVTVQYSGDTFYEPAQVTGTITVLPARGRTFECINRNFLFADRFNVNVAAHANLPAAAQVGRPLPLAQLDVAMYADRGAAFDNFGAFFPPHLPVIPPGDPGDGIAVAELGFGSLGTGSVTAMTLANQLPMDDSTRPVDPDPDLVIGFEGEAASLAVEGDPGDVVPIELESIELEAHMFGFAFTLSCTAVGDPASLGSVPIAGTTLTVEGPDPIRAGDAVTLRASVAPTGTPGTVELRDGSTTLAVVPVGSDGTATYTTDDLAPGSHSLTAVFRAGSAVLSSTSPPVEVTVLAAIDCAAFADAGHGRVVRLVYLTLLQRCPDEGGYDYWVGRLEGGTTPAAFARAISNTDEAVGVLVSDAYRTVLLREAETAGKAFWVDRLQAGVRYERLLASLAESPEFFGHAGATRDGFIGLLYQRILLRPVDPAGLEYWRDQMVNGATRGQVAKALTGTAETRLRLTVTAYDRTLGRAPTPAERDAADAHLRATGDLAGLYERIIATPEFIARAQTNPNPTIV